MAVVEEQKGFVGVEQEICEEKMVSAGENMVEVLQRNEQELVVQKKEQECVKALQEEQKPPVEVLQESNRSKKPMVKVPPRSIFMYSERYLSPTDSLLSPISKGLLARSRKPLRMPVPPKALETAFHRLNNAAK